MNSLYMKNPKHLNTLARLIVLELKITQSEKL